MDDRQKAERNRRLREQSLRGVVSMLSEEGVLSALACIKLVKGNVLWVVRAGGLGIQLLSNTQASRVEWVNLVAYLWAHTWGWWEGR